MSHVYNQNNQITSDLPGIDLIKLIMAFAVIAIHAPEYLWPENRVWPPIFNWFIRLAVPFFFVVSGFLTQRQIESYQSIKLTRRKLFSKAKNLFKLWIVWTIVYLPLTLWGLSHEQNPLSEKLYILFYDLIFCGHGLYAQPLWFLYSMSFIFAIWGCVNRTVGIILLLGCFVFIDICNHYSILNPSLSSIAVWILGGGAPIFVGALFFKILNVYRPGSKIIGALAISSLSMSLLCYAYNIPYSPLSGGLALFMAGFIFRPKMNLNFLRIRKTSMWIYYLHMYLVIAIMITARLAHVTLNRWYAYPIICLMMWVLSLGIIRLSKKESFSFLNLLLK